MRLQALLLCPDEKIERVIRRVLGDLEISVDYCKDTETALYKLTRERYEAVVVDCDDEEAAARVLKSARTAVRNKRAVAVALIDTQKRVRGAFELGAHFVLYKPISAERAKTSFRAARALMKRERRRNVRIPVEIPVQLSFAGAGEFKATTSDLGEGGIAVQVTQRLENSPNLTVRFTLPVSNYPVESKAEIAWVNAGRSAGIRFTNLEIGAQDKIKEWLDNQSPDLDTDDPPAACKLTDLSQGGCYLELATPFPMRTKVILSLGAASPELKVEGIVLVAHPEIGMGVEFSQKTPKQQKQLENFIQALVGGSTVPEVFVQPEGLENEESKEGELPLPADPLVALFRTKADLPLEDFQKEIQKQRGAPQHEEDVLA